MSNITLPRAVVWRLHAAFRDADKTIRPSGEKSDYSAEIAVLEAALEEPEQKPEPSGYAYRYNDGVLRFNDGTQINGARPIEALPYFFASPAAALAEPGATHPGYIIGSHWLETAYSRIAAGEAEADVLAEVLGARGWVRPDAISARYNELLMAVWQRHPGETRHETALRYITQAERQSATADQAKEHKT